MPVDEMDSLKGKMDTGDLKRSFDGLPKMNPLAEPPVETKPTSTGDLVTESFNGVVNLAPQPDIIAPPQPVAPSPTFSVDKFDKMAPPTEEKDKP